MPTGYGARVPVRDGGANLSRESRQSGFGAVGLGFLTGDNDDDSDSGDEYPPRSQTTPATNASHAQPTGPAPAYNTASSTVIRQEPSPPKPALQGHRVDPAAQNPTPPIYSRDFPQAAGQTNPHPQHTYKDPRTNMRVVIPNTAQPVPRSPRPAFINVPEPKARIQSPSLSPHPLEAPRVPIAPAFARPSLASQSREVKFSADSIMRGNSEETLLSRNTPKGAEFWRRFSVIVKDEHFEPGKDKRSSWLEKHQSRSSRMNVCVWIIALTLIIAIGGIGTLVYFFTHNSPSSVPQAIGGSADQSILLSSSSSVSRASSTTSPLRTVTGGLPPSTTPSINFPPLPTTAGAAKRENMVYLTMDLPVVTAMPASPFAAHRRNANRKRG